MPYYLRCKTKGCRFQAWWQVRETLKGEAVFYEPLCFMHKEKYSTDFLNRAIESPDKVDMKLAIRGLTSQERTTRPEAPAKVPAKRKPASRREKALRFIVYFEVDYACYILYYGQDQRAAERIVNVMPKIVARKYSMKYQQVRV